MLKSLMSARVPYKSECFVWEDNGLNMKSGTDDIHKLTEAIYKVSLFR